MKFTGVHNICRISNTTFLTNDFLLADPANVLSSFNDTIENATNTLRLSCRFEGIPSPQVHWYMTPGSTGEEQLLSNSGRITISHEVDGDGNSYSELVIDDLRKSDEGSYKCMGSNGVENLIGAIDSSEGFITVYGKVCLYDHTCTSNPLVLN